MSFKFKLAALAAAMSLMALLIAATAVGSWRRIGEMRDRLVRIQSESFRIADQFQRFLLQVNDALASYGTTHTAADWERYTKASAALNAWIDEQKPKLISPDEKRAMQQIDEVYDVYLATANALRAQVVESPQRTTSLAESSRVRIESEHLLSVDNVLADAHRKAMTRILTESSQIIGRQGLLLLSSLALLLVFGTGLGIVVYRDMIAPLRVKLVESQALVERHEKLASLGMLAAGVAHEIRNPLTAIKAALFLQLKKAKPGSQDRADLELVGGEITRLEHIVRDFLQFARPAEPQLVATIADQPLRHVQKLLSPGLAKNRIRLILEDAPPVHIKIDPEQIGQVLLNLVQNAAEAIGQDGTVTLRARLDSRPLGGRSTKVVVLDVADTGPGIPPEVEKRLFDPFFSTKSAGTGLGLSIAARIVEKHGGALQYQTEAHRGTTFGIVLPRAEA